MSDVPYSNREIDRMLSSLETKLLDPDEGILPRIERQTIKTNGRVSALEQWRGIVLGGLAVIIVLIVPVAIEVVEKALAL